MYFPTQAWLYILVCGSCVPDKRGPHNLILGPSYLKVKRRKCIFMRKLGYSCQFVGVASRTKRYGLYNLILDRPYPKAKQADGVNIFSYTHPPPRLIIYTVINLKIVVLLYSSPAFNIGEGNSGLCTASG